MPSVLAWLAHDEKARERTLRILSLFNERESRDELGLGAIRDSFADQLFPGTSTIQTRLRYMFFVPWIYQILENKQIPSKDFANQVDKIERELIKPLLTSEDNDGIFGKTSGNKLKRLPSSVYWAALRTWGIHLAPFSQNEYHRRIDQIYILRNQSKKRMQHAQERGDDINVTQEKIIQSWHPKLPAPPKNFPIKADLALSQEEAFFIKGCIQAKHHGSLLSFLASCDESVDVVAPWEHPRYNNFSDSQKKLLTHAKLFSEVMHGAALAYNIQLARLRKNEDLIAEHETNFSSWIKNIPLKELRSWSLPHLWELTAIRGHAITKEAQHFVAQWLEYTRKTPRDLLLNVEAMNLVKAREIHLKKGQSRFENQRALMQWGGRSGTTRLNYRWAQVKILLNDLHLGMNQEEKC